MNLFSFITFQNKKYSFEFIFGKILSKLISLLPNYNYLLSQQKILTQIENSVNARIEEGASLYSIKIIDNTFILRNNTSDLDVYNQVFLIQEYKPVVDFIMLNLNISLHTIVDAGANIGLTTIYFSQYFKNASIIAIEADFSNYKILNQNTKYLNNVKTINAALWNADTSLSINSNFRDGRSWSRCVSEIKQSNINESLVSGIDVNSLFELFSLDCIDLFKIDIEGSESKIFSHTSNLSFLEKTNILVLEIHDEVSDRLYIYNLLINHGFIIFSYNETTLCIKKRLLK